MLIKTDFLRPRGFVKITVTDKNTGEYYEYVRKQSLFDYVDELLLNIPGSILQNFGHNTATYDARRVAAKLLAGMVYYKANYIEWGDGGENTPAATRSDNALKGPYTPRLITAINSKEFPTADERAVKFKTKLSDEGPYAPNNTIIKEVGLYTHILSEIPSGSRVSYPNFPTNGYLIARHVIESGIDKTSASTEVGVEWMYIYN